MICILVGLFACPPLQAQQAAADQSYRATGLPDPDVVRRVVATLGVGKTVDVKTTSSKKLRAKIQSIDASGFTVTHGRTPVPLAITYDEVTQLKPAGWPAAAKIALAAGAVVGVSVLSFFLCWATGSCSN